MNDADKEDAFESMRHQLKSMDQALKAAQGVARVQRSKRLRTEAQLEGVVESMKKMTEEIKCRAPVLCASVAWFVWLFDHGLTLILQMSEAMERGRVTRCRPN